MAGSTSSPYSSTASSRCGTPEGYHTAVISFISNAVTPRRPYTEQKRLLAQALLAHPHFARNGELLQTMEKGVIYPSAHLAEYSGHKLQHNEQLLEAGFLGEDYVLHQGIYEEIKQHFPNGTTHSHSFYTPPTLDSTVYILAGFKVIDSTFQDVMEDSWKDWTGARSLYINLADDFGLHRFSLYRRLRPARDFTTFMYILLVECRTVTRRNTLRLLDFVSRFRVQRMTGYLSVYSAQKLGVTGSSPYSSSGDLLLQNSNHPSNSDWWKQVEDSAATSSEVSETSSNDDVTFQERETSNEEEDDDDDDDAVFATVTPTSTPSPTRMDEHYAQRRKNGYSMMPIYENHVEDEVDCAILPNSYSLRHARRKRADNNGSYLSPVGSSTLKYQDSPTSKSSQISFANGHAQELVIEDFPDTRHWSTTQSKGKMSVPNCYTLDGAIALASLRSNGSTTTTDKKSTTSLLNGHLDVKAKELLELDEMLQNLQCATGPVLSVGMNKIT